MDQAIVAENNGIWEVNSQKFLKTGRKKSNFGAEGAEI